MIRPDLTTGNILVKQIDAINEVLQSYNNLHNTQGQQATYVEIKFGEFGSITFEDSGLGVVDLIASSLITSLTNKRNTLQTEFDNLGNNDNSGL